MKVVRVVFASVAAGAAIVCASACGSFLSSPDEVTPEGDVDASNDAPTSPDAPPSTDAGIDAIDDAASSCATTTQPVFHDDFTTSDLGKWEPLSANCEVSNTSFPAGDAGDLSVALACSTKIQEAYNVLQSVDGFPSVARTRVSFGFLVGATDSHVFGQLLHVYGAFGANLAFVATPTNIEIWNRKGGERLTFWPAGNAKQWHTMDIDLEPIDPIGGTMNMRASLDGVSRNPVALVREADGGEGQFRLQIGPYANVGAGGFEDAYDAIRIWSCP